MKKLLALLFSFFLLSSHSVSADEIDDMLFEMTSDLNSSLPMRVDSLTTWDSSIYLKNENLFTYLYTLDNYDRQSDYDASVLNDFFNNVVTKFCTDPDTRFLLGLTDVSMKYFNLNGEYLFKNEFSENQC
ncbi:hypothetical protein N9R34_01385 [Candidatus Thioglobus sp.]|nr:hypothetical protein [Candidatus Thioglobus sp.]MDB4099207.1 hypothetical protein [Candidatus Thioglobus sp.]